MLSPSSPSAMASELIHARQRQIADDFRAANQTRTWRFHLRRGRNDTRIG